MINRLAGSITEDANPEGINQYSGAASRISGEANKWTKRGTLGASKEGRAAAAASHQAHLSSISASNPETHDRAAEAHRAAAQAHHNAAAAQRSSAKKDNEKGFSSTRDIHKRLANGHDVIAKMHEDLATRHDNA